MQDDGRACGRRPPSQSHLQAWGPLFPPLNLHQSIRTLRLRVEAMRPGGPAVKEARRPHPTCQAPSLPFHRTSSGTLQLTPRGHGQRGQWTLAWKQVPDFHLPAGVHSHHSPGSEGPTTGCLDLEPTTLTPYHHHQAPRRLWDNRSQKAGGHLPPLGAFLCQTPPALGIPILKQGPRSKA